MMEFELESEWGGWDHVTILDDLEIVLRKSKTDTPRLAKQIRKSQKPFRR